MTVFGDRTSRAFRDLKRRCDLCGENIVKGDRVRRGCVKDAGDFWAYVEHETCSNLAWELWGNGDWPASRWPFRYEPEVFYESQKRLAADRLAWAAEKGEKA